jgi:Ca2+-binding RTX toxin-like protein
MVALSGLHATSTGTVAKAIGAAGLIVGSSDAHAVVWRPAADSDGDGVPDALDVAVTTPPGSVGFSDAVAPDSPALGVGTYGVITPNGLGVSVQDLNPNTASSAVRVSALAGAGSGPLDLMACGEEPAWALEADDVVSVACGSVSIDVQGGDGVTGRSGSSSIALAVGTRATFESLGESLVITGVEDGPVTVTVDLALDAVVTFPAGTAGTIDTTTAALTDVTGDGVTLTVGGMEVPISAGPGVTLIQGGVQNDTISGTPEDDVIVDAGGNNTINGRSGNDVIATAGGNDTIDGSAGNDRIDAGDGNNQVKGGDGDDRITTGRGNDTIDGGRHTDVCSPGIGKDSLKNCETRS